MARILVLAEDEKSVLLDERSVTPDHLRDTHSAQQLLERVGWAVGEESRERPRRKARPRVAAKSAAITRTFE